jgi:hypothetical protein
MLSSENYGQTGFDYSIIEQIASRIRNKLNKGVQARSYETPWQDEYRDSDWPTNHYS